jgi:hypothetical protein
MRAYMEVGYQGIFSVENEDPILSGEVGVERALYVLKNVRSELLGTSVKLAHQENLFRRSSASVRSSASRCRRIPVDGGQPLRTYLAFASRLPSTSEAEQRPST